VLDLANPAAFGYVRERLGALLAENAIDFLKWDHNRDLVEAGHEGRAATRLQTLAVYRLLDELREEHPELEIESCSSGGARVDLAILEHTDRVWTSDSNDALERQGIQRWTGLFVPPELLGSHVGPARSETSGRVQSRSFRAATALFGHAGIEWDIGAIGDDERAMLTAWVELYKRLRGLLHTGDVVHADHPDEAALVHGVVARDGSAAVFAYVQLAGSRAAVPAPARLPGLAAERRYRVTPLEPLPETTESRPPPWYAAGWLEAPGEVLGAVGLALPVLDPEQALLLEVRAVA
jgi:alpha-galactosidase